MNSLSRCHGSMASHIFSRLILLTRCIGVGFCIALEFFVLVLEGMWRPFFCGFFCIIWGKLLGRQGMLMRAVVWRYSHCGTFRQAECQ